MTTSKQDVEVTVEPIPFAGMVAVQDKEDTEEMLRDQLHFVKELYDSLDKNYTELLAIFCDIAVTLREKYPDAADELNAIISTHKVLNNLMQNKK